MWGHPYTVSVHEKSKTVWIAVGEYMIVILLLVLAAGFVALRVPSSANATLSKLEE